MLSALPSIVVLGLAALVALFLARSRLSPTAYARERVHASRALTVAVVFQGLHFLEEAATGFHSRFPALFDLGEIPRVVFIAFNVIWLGVWIASVVGVRSGLQPAFFAAWFLAIAAMFNGIAHPLLAVASGGYFPGLISAPIIGISGVWLWRRLRAATRAPAP